MKVKRYEKPLFRLSGDRALIVQYGEGIDLAINERVRTVTALLREELPEGVDAIIPAYNSLALVYDPLRRDVVSLKELILSAEDRTIELTVPSAQTVEIPVCYGGEYGPDIEFVGEYHGLEVKEVMSIHSSTNYHIYMLGFAPGFCYLGGLDERLHTPRLETPRTHLPAGSVGIAEAQTGMYPLASPGGWRLIGRTPVKLFDPSRELPFLYQAGDRIRFVPISPEEYDRLAEREER